MIRLTTPRNWREYFPKIANALFAELGKDEFLVLNLISETSVYVRLNSSKIRQVTDIEDTVLHLDLVVNRNRRATAEMPLAFATDDDTSSALAILRTLRKEALISPSDTAVAEPPANIKSETIIDEQDFRSDDWLLELLNETDNKPIYGVISAGRDIRGMMSSAGGDHWFQTSRYIFDYSLRSQSGLAIKNVISDHKWNREAVRQQLAQQNETCRILDEPIRVIPKGSHRVYLAPQAMRELMQAMASSFGESTFRQGSNPFLSLRDKSKKLNPQIQLLEHAIPGIAPRFNEIGELAPENMPILENGELKYTLISSRTAKEYGLSSNGARSPSNGIEAFWGSESLRAAELKPGTLPTQDVLKTLGTGLYIGNLHYLNWSDLNQARMTGMTRFDCFLVENGELVGPFAPMRFDCSIFDLLGSSLEALTAESSLFVNTMSYENRSLGGWKVPGAIIQGMTFTL